MVRTLDLGDFSLLGALTHGALCNAAPVRPGVAFVPGFDAPTVIDSGNRELDTADKKFIFANASVRRDRVFGARSPAGAGYSVRCTAGHHSEPWVNVLPTLPAAPSEI
jgi:hypothetical protein